MSDPVNIIDAAKDLLVIMFIVGENFDDMPADTIRKLDDVKDVILNQLALSGSPDISAEILANHLFSKYGV